MDSVRLIFSSPECKAAFLSLGVHSPAPENTVYVKCLDSVKDSRARELPS